MIQDGNTNRITEVAAPPTRDTMAVAAVLGSQRLEEGDLLLVKVPGGNNNTSINSKKR